MSDNTQLPIIGVLGGGQLGRMMLQVAINYNLDVRCMDPDTNAPCKSICSDFTVGSLQSFDDVVKFGHACDIITIEIENVNTEALKALQKMGKKVFPQPEIIELIQDKRVQKQFYKENGIPTSPFILVNSKEEVHKNIDFLPAVNKLGKAGYDGKGVAVLKTIADLNKAFDEAGLLEKYIPFEKELSVIVARNENGQIKTFPTVELVFHPEHNLVDFLFSPADIAGDIEEKAQSLAKLVVEKLGIVGLLAVEMFLTKDGEILVNEIAPRTHNSGHQSIEGNITSQFDQHLRAILNWPLGDTSILIPSAMVNLLGEMGHTGSAVYQGLDEVLALDGVYVHLYGKKITKPARKMGHVTIIDADKDNLIKKAKLVKQKLKVIA
jgi:5-(carboxyamino)imidazole ribonucleotide synthase